MRRGVPKDGSTTIAVRLANSSLAQLKAEAKAVKKPLGAYVRWLLQAYAPGVKPDAAEKEQTGAKMRAAVLISEL